MLKVLLIGKKNLEQSKIQGLDKYKTISLDWHTSYRSNFIYNHDVALVFNEWKPSNRIFINKLRQINIPVLYLIDGIIDWNYLHHNWAYIKPHGTFLQPLVSDAVGVVGNGQKNILSAIVDPSKIEVIGIPRLDNFKKAAKHKVIENNDILITTATTPYLNDSAKINVSKALKFLSDYLVESNLSVIWRIRPDLAKEIGVKSDSKSSLKTQISRSKCVLSFSSTVIIESMKLGKPTGLIDFSTNPNLIQTTWFLNSKDNISNFFKSILNPTTEHFSHQESCLQSLLYSGNSCKKLINTLYGLARESPPYKLKEKRGYQNPDQTNVESKDHVICNDKDLNSYILDAYTKQHELNVKTLQIVMTRIDEFIKDTEEYKEISKKHIHSFLKRISNFIDYYK